MQPLIGEADYCMRFRGTGIGIAVETLNDEAVVLVIVRCLNFLCYPKLNLMYPGDIPDSIPIAVGRAPLPHRRSRRQRSHS